MFSKVLSTKACFTYLFNMDSKFSLSEVGISQSLLSVLPFLFEKVKNKRLGCLGCHSHLVISSQYTKLYILLLYKLLFPIPLSVTILIL